MKLAEIHSSAKKIFAGAGCIFFARSSKRFLLARRSSGVNHPNTWATWGGQIDSNETPEQTVVREVKEEAGFALSANQLIPLMVYQDSKIIYHNFVAVVDSEFEPAINWENNDYDWFELGKFPNPLHFGLAAMLNNPASWQKLKSLILAF